VVTHRLFKAWELRSWNKNKLMLHIPPPNVPIVTGATAITNATKGATFILVFNEAIWMGTHLEHSLLNPNQMRHHGITVQDNPYANE
jgi:hypothetical protein